MLRICQGDSNFDRGVCHSYLAGIHDAHGSFAHSRLLAEQRYCTPEGIEVGALKKALLTSAGAHPEILHRTASKPGYRRLPDRLPLRLSARPAQAASP